MPTPIYATLAIAQARSFLGTPWRHRGRTPAGLDCIGLVVLSLLAGGWRPRFPKAVNRRTYSRRSDGAFLLSTLRAEGEALAANSALLPLDVVTFTFEADPCVQHVGLVTQAPKIEGGPAYFIHASGPSKCVVEQALSDGWKDALGAVFRLPGVVQLGGVESGG